MKEKVEQKVEEPQKVEQCMVKAAKELAHNDCFWKRCHFMGNVNEA